MLNLKKWVRTSSRSGWLLELLTELKTKKKLYIKILIKLFNIVTKIKFQNLYQTVPILSWHLQSTLNASFSNSEGVLKRPKCVFLSLKVIFWHWQKIVQNAQRGVRGHWFGTKSERKKLPFRVAVVGYNGVRGAPQSPPPPLRTKRR